MITSGAVFVRLAHPHRRVTLRHAQASDFADPLGPGGALPTTGCGTGLRPGAERAPQGGGSLVIWRRTSRKER
jgi:hypothetical protein